MAKDLQDKLLYELKSLNNLTSNILSIGQILKIPTNLMMTAHGLLKAQRAKLIILLPELLGKKAFVR